MTDPISTGIEIAENSINLIDKLRIKNLKL